MKRGNGGTPSWRNATIVETMYPISIDHLRRRGMLEAGRNADYHRHPDDETAGAIVFAAREGHAEILQFNDRWIIVSQQRIDYRRREMGYGARLYFACPSCRRAVGIVYVHPEGRIGCRLCFAANYISTTLPPHERAERRARAIRHRLVLLAGGVPDPDDETFPPKPKWMRWPIYYRLQAEHDEYLKRWARRWGYSGESTRPRKPCKTPKPPRVDLDAKYPHGVLGGLERDGLLKPTAEQMRIAGREALLQKAIEEYRDELAAEGLPLPASLRDWRPGR